MQYVLYSTFFNIANYYGHPFMPICTQVFLSQDGYSMMYLYVFHGHLQHLQFFMVISSTIIFIIVYVSLHICVFWPVCNCRSLRNGSLLHVSPHYNVQPLSHARWLFVLFFLIHYLLMTSYMESSLIEDRDRLALQIWQSTSLAEYLQRKVPRSMFSVLLALGGGG